MEILRHAASIFVGFASGVIVAGAVFAFITAVGVVPRLAQKTKTNQHIRIYEMAIGLGGLLGVAAVTMQIYLPIGTPAVVILSLFVGIFLGCLAMSLAETLNVIPIFTRRARLQRGIFFLILAIAIGKMAGSLMYFLVPGFFDTGNM
ncbi:MAG: stage V sporulation protein AB [Defluviitaleaceae bacterium]|nr:stage V sporulation protein AB [Defluviitaleaceae bacterium]